MLTALRQNDVKDVGMATSPGGAGIVPGEKGNGGKAATESESATGGQSAASSGGGWPETLPKRTAPRRGEVQDVPNQLLSYSAERTRDA